MVVETLESQFENIPRYTSKLNLLIIPILSSWKYCIPHDGQLVWSKLIHIGMKIQLLGILALFMTVVGGAQTVETLVIDSVIHDGIYVDSNGHIFTTSGGLTGSDHIGRYDIDTQTFESEYANGFAGPINIATYRDSLLIVTNYDNNTVSSYNLNSGLVTEIASGLDGPSGIAVDDAENIYITNWGQSPAWLGTQIHKIDANGNLSVLADDPLLENPQAIVINELGEIIVHSSTWLYKVDVETGSVSPWTFLGISVPNMVFRNTDNCIYAVGDEKVLKIDGDGVLSILSGGDTGYLDGTLAEALYTDIIGAAFSPDEQILYVSESAYQTGIGRLRALNLDEATGIFEATAGEISMEAYPTIVNQSLNVHLTDNSTALLRMLTLSGKEVMGANFSSSTVIDCSNLAKGAYLVQVRTSNGMAVKRIVKE